MVDFNRESFKTLSETGICYYDVLEMVELMQIYFNDRTKFEPRINGKLKDELLWQIMEKFKQMNGYCGYLHIEPFVPENITKKEEHDLIYKFFEWKMGFNRPKSKYMTNSTLKYDKQYFNDDVVCYKCPSCKRSKEFAVELVNKIKDECGHIGVTCEYCNKLIFPLFIRNITTRKVIMKD